MGTFVWTNWGLVVFQLVYPEDVKLTEKEVMSPTWTSTCCWCCAVLIVCLWADFDRRAASVTCPSQTPTQVRPARSFSLVVSRTASHLSSSSISQDVSGTLSSVSGSVSRSVAEL